MTARLSHPSIVPVHGFGEVGGDVDDTSAMPLVYIVMKYVHGEVARRAHASRPNDSRE